jgi:hypothetical protein
MKPYLIILALAFTNLASAKPLQVQIEITYKGVNPLFINGISDKKASTLKMPTVTTKDGKEAVINIIREMKIQRGTKEWEYLNCGAAFEVTPVIHGREIEVFGKSILRYNAPKTKTPEFSTDTFITHETFVHGNLLSGRPIEIKGDSKEKIVIKATILNMDGTPY